MLPPSMDYEVGKGRQYELEQKGAKRRLVEEALDAQRLERRGLLARIVAFLRRARHARSVQMPAGREGEAARQYRTRFTG